MSVSWFRRTRRSSSFHFSCHSSSRVCRSPSAVVHAHRGQFAEEKGKKKERENSEGERRMALESGSVGSVAGCVRMNRAARARASCDHRALAVRSLLTRTAAAAVSVSVALHCIAVCIPTVLCSICILPSSACSPSLERRRSRLSSPSLPPPPPSSVDVGRHVDAEPRAGSGRLPHHAQGKIARRGVRLLIAPPRRDAAAK